MIGWIFAVLVFLLVVCFAILLAPSWSEWRDRRRRNRRGGMLP